MSSGDVPDVNSLTLVLSSPRSGSTLLCRDLASLGGLGFPREYLKKLEAEARPRQPSEADVLGLIARGVRDDAPGVAGLKLMVSQSAQTYAAITGERASTTADAMSGVVGWARARFDRVLLVFLFRNVVDQAISRAVADATGIFHSTDRALRSGEAVPLPLEDMNQRIFTELFGVVRNQRVLAAVLSEHADIALALTYDELATQVEATTSTLVAHARAHGFEVERETATRRLKKVISPERSSAMRESFLDFLMTDPGIPHDFLRGHAVEDVHRSEQVDR